MRCSVFSVLDEQPELRAQRGGDRYEEAIALAKEADRDGFHTFWVAEHHFHAGGVLPVPAVFLAAASRETRRLRLGVMVSVLPLHSPREVAEQYALVDRLSGGRLELGFGSGYIPVELQGFGVLPAERRARFDAALPEVLAALRGEPIPVPGDPQLTVRLNVRPVQEPLPPLWVAVQSREALPFVARRGLSVGLIPYASVSSLEELARNISEYRAALPPGASSCRVAAAMHTYVGDRPAAARAALQRYLDARLAHRSTHFQVRVREAAEAATVEGLEARGMVLFARPGEVVARVEALERAGVTDLLGIFDFGGLEPSLARSSLRRFATAMGLRSQGRAREVPRLPA